MKIKEVEKLLSVSRSNIRFYEIEGLINPERHGNNYREYSEADVAMLKKILVLRKLGFSVDDISAMQNGTLELACAAEDNITRLQTEIDRLNGALEATKAICDKQPTFDDFDVEYYWDSVNRAEKEGEKFADICRDYLIFERDSFDRMWKYVFFHDFKKSRKKYGVMAACIILLVICLLRGLSKMLIWHESFLQGFLYPFVIFAVGSLILLPIYVLSKKAPKVAAVISLILLSAAVLFIAVLIVLIIYGVIKSALA